MKIIRTLLFLTGLILAFYLSWIEIASPVVAGNTCGCTEGASCSPNGAFCENFHHCTGEGKPVFEIFVCRNFKWEYDYAQEGGSCSASCGTPIPTPTAAACNCTGGTYSVLFRANRNLNPGETINCSVSKQGSCSCAGNPCTGAQDGGSCSIKPGQNSCWVNNLDCSCKPYNYSCSGSYNKSGTLASNVVNGGSSTIDLDLPSPTQPPATVPPPTQPPATLTIPPTPTKTPVPTTTPTQATATPSVEEPTSTPQPTVTSVPAAPYCRDYCEGDDDCSPSSYECYDYECRNRECLEEEDCICPGATATTVPTAPPGEPTYTPVPTATPTKALPSPTSTPPGAPPPTATPIPPPASTPTPIPSCNCEKIEYQGEFKPGGEVTFTTYATVDDPTNNPAEVLNMVYHVHRGGRFGEEIATSPEISAEGPERDDANNLDRYRTSWKFTAPSEGQGKVEYYVWVKINCGWKTGTQTVISQVKAGSIGQVVNFFSSLFGRLFGIQNVVPTPTPAEFGPPFVTVIAPTGAQSLQLGTFFPATPTPVIEEGCTWVRFWVNY